MSLIEFIKLKKVFGTKKVLDELSLSIDQGETLTVLGGSGSGKTVLLKILLALVPYDTGQVVFDGRDVGSMSEEELRLMRRRMGMLFQGGALFDSLSVKENIAYPLREHFKYSEEEIDRIVAEKLGLVGLPGVQESYPADLSGGMKKRVALARAIATDPEVILYDEPTTGLDPMNTSRIDHLINDLRQKLKVTSIVVTHDMDSAFFISDRLALLDKGRIVFVGTPEEVKRSKNPVVHDFISGSLNQDHEKGHHP